MNKSIVLVGVLGLLLFGLAGYSFARINNGYVVDEFCGTNLYDGEREECLLCHTDSWGEATPAREAFTNFDFCYFCSAQGTCGGSSLDADGDGFEASVDCNDHNPNINPGAVELCFDYTDNDCNGLEDDNRNPALSEPCYNGPLDADNDGFDIIVDCNDNDASVNFNATEICDDTKDNDCNGLADLYDPACVISPVDADSDGYDENVDCNDNDATINPGAVEICDDAKDNDCNDLIDVQDPACGTVICTDDDADGYSVEGSDCGPVDCNDNDTEINPGACDVKSDGIDQDCSGKDRLKGKACPGSEPPSVTCSDFTDSTNCKSNGCRWSKKNGICS